jgi:hypothetical protein
VSDALTERETPGVSSYVHLSARRTRSLEILVLSVVVSVAAVAAIAGMAMMLEASQSDVAD